MARPAHGQQALPPDRLPGSETGRRRLTAIMFTDMVGYSALTRKSELLALELIEQHNSLLRRRFAEHGGREIKALGDGFMLAFASALNAVRCAIAIQHAVHERNAGLPPDQTFHIRIGVHAGDVVHQGEDLFGDGVNLASRIECLARPGGICVSEQVADLIRPAIGHPLIKLGKAKLKNIPTPVRLYYVRLPWEKRPASWRDRALFACFHHGKSPSLADLTNAALAAAVAGFMLWQSVAGHGAIHATLWFGENAPTDTRSHGAPGIAPLSMSDVLSGQYGAVSLEHPLVGVASALERRSPVTEQRAGVIQTTQPPDLLSLMVKRDSGSTFHFARHYDRVRAQLQKSSGSPRPAQPGLASDTLTALEQGLFEELFARTLKPETTAVAGRTL